MAAKKTANVEPWERAMNTKRFDAHRAAVARDDGIAYAEVGAGTDWMLEAMLAIRRVAQVKFEFTSDDLWVHIDPPREPRALGAAMMGAKRQGLCEATDRTVRSTRVACHARPLRIWRSLVWTDKGASLSTVALPPPAVGDF